MEKVEAEPVSPAQEESTQLMESKSSSNEEQGSEAASPVGVSGKGPRVYEDSFDYPDDQVARDKIISAALQKEDEFLEYLMSLPAGGKDKDKSAKPAHQPPLMRSASEKAGTKVGLDHLDNLCKLMEQLGDLRERNSKLQRRVQYLEDLKNLQEMHKQLQQETMKRQLQEAALLQSIQMRRQATYTPDGSHRRSKKHCRHRQSLQPASQHRERSQSVGLDELNDYHETYEHANSKQTKRRQRRSLAAFGNGNKAKVSKWTKVKEAFRWEKASVVTLPETKSQDSGLGGITHHCCDDGGRYLRVPVGENMLSGSPSADSVISGHSICSSGAPSPGGEFVLPTVSAMSSSSSSEELDIDLNYSDILSEFVVGPRRSASASDSTAARVLVQEPRRLSLTCTPEEEEASRRSKSLDGDAVVGPNLSTRQHFGNKEGVKSPAQTKHHKTPWGKVKDIIQTRKDSLKKRQHRVTHKGGDGATSSDHEDEATPETTPGDAELPPSSVDDVTDMGAKTVARPRIEITPEAPTPNRRHKMSTSSLGAYPEATPSRRLTPMLTITLPSTEELRQLNPIPALASPKHHHTTSSPPKCSSKPPPSPQTEERQPKSPSSPLQIDDGKGDYFKHHHSTLFGPTSGSVGTSPPVHRRTSKWTKVKKAFLTSPGRRDDPTTSGPSSPNRISTFFYETDPDELSSGELGEAMGEEDDAQRESTSEPTSLQAEIQRNYEELQTKLSQEFHKKLHEWERMKASSSATSPGTCRASTSAAMGGEDNYHHDKSFRRKMEEWEKIKQKEGTSNGKRESMALQPLDEDQLSPHFRKKLHEWQRIKKTNLPREDNSQSRKKIVEWQLWRTGSGKQGNEDQDDFHRKLQEWERIKSASPCDSPTTKEAGVECDRNSTGAKTPSPGVVRKDSTGEKKKAHAGGAGGGGAGAKSGHKAKTQKEKELHWLEKELQKIEREKQRLEREREKYLDREQRLEKMRRAVGSGAGKQEVLIQTSTGFFRFQGISEKFTRRLYEWEKARGIAPEASTFALLDPGYRPSREERPGGGDATDNVMLMRSKSAGSVTKLSSPGQAGATISHQPSSLSLNDVEALEQAEQDLADSRATSDPQLHGDEEDDEPAAVIVDVEDVVEETAAPLLATPVVEGQTPVYCYAPEEVTRLIDSSGSESDRDGAATVRRTDSLRTNGSENERLGAASVRRTDSVRTESSYKLLEENMTLLTKLKIKGDICRKLENELEDLEEKIDHVTKTHEEELERLRQEETDLQDLSPESAIMEDDLTQTGPNLSQGESTSGDQGALVGQLRAKITELERRQERLRREGVTLQDSFAQHSEQQAALAQNLVGKMKQLQEVNSNMASCELDEPCADSSVTSRQENAMAVVQNLSTQLLTLAEKLEEALGERNREIHNLRSELEERRCSEGGRGASEDGTMGRGISTNDVSLSMGSLPACDVFVNARRSGPYIPRQSSVELTQLPSLLTHKVLELKEGLNYLCATADPNPDADTRDNTTTFILKVKPKKPRHDVKVKTSVTSHGDDGSSPVTSVTITPGFWKRRGTEGDASPPPSDRVSSMDDQYGKTFPSSSHESFCSARSSSETSSAFGDEVKTVATKVRENNNNSQVNLKEDASGKTKPGAKVTRDGTSKKHAIEMPIDASRKERVENGNFNLEGGVATDGRQKRPFKTRRASDTYDAYKRNENRNGVLQNKVLRNSDGDPKDVGSRLRENENEEETNFTFKLSKETTERNDNAEPRSNSIVRTASQVLRRGPVVTSTPVNVFVQTTRKIFAPVRRDSKGKASSVISYVVEEPEPPENTQRAPTAEASTARAASLVPTPQWMIMRSRSQSASPALPRRKVLGENSPEYSYPRGLKISPDKCRKEETTASEESSSSTSKETVQDGEVKLPATESNVQAVARRRTVSAEDQKEPPVDTDKRDVVISAPRPTTPMGFPPLPPSPSPSRRDLFKHVAKDTAPSIRMMIAKYNQKLTEQDGAKSPEIGRSGSGSPVAWRSPVAERRVPTQMAKYQEEVQRVLMQGSRRIGRIGGSEVQKSASAGVIRSPEATVNQPRASTSQGDCSVTDNPPRSVGAQRRGILKSSSAGSIKPAASVPFTPPTSEEPIATRKIIPISESLPDNAPSASECNLANKGAFKKPVGAVSPILSRSPTPNSTSASSDVGSPPLSRLRALRLQRAKEEFLTRGPGGKSWISEGGTPLLPTPTPSTSTSPEPVWIRDIERFTGEYSGNRLSQISVGSDSSYDGSLVVPPTHACPPQEVIDDDGLLVKSASAGMINVDPHTYKKFSLERVNECTGLKKEKSKDHAKFGISSITSKFRKVKMRKSKEKGDNNKMNTVSLLCRQSLLVDINKKESNKNGEGPSSSVSCPSSPVLQRGSTEGKDDDDPIPGTSSWIRNPAKLIFRPK